MLADPTSPDAVEQNFNVVPMNFRTDFVPVKGKPGEFKDVQKVDLVKKGSNGESTPWTISALKKEQFLWPHIERYYENWLKGQEDPVDGVPLDVLPFLPRGIVDHLKNIHIRTAEDLAGATDGDLERIGMGGRGWREKARTYLEAKDGDAKISEANVELRATVDFQADQIAELTAQVNSLVALQGGAPITQGGASTQGGTPEPKKRRGRPPKQ